MLRAIHSLRTLFVYYVYTDIILFPLVTYIYLNKQKKGFTFFLSLQDVLLTFT